jgi:hypothetical protein
MKLSPSTVIATIALVFSMSGASFAAGHYLITSTAQIKPSVLKQLEAKSSRTISAQGPIGPSGAIGATGLQGAGSVGPTGPAGTDGALGPSGATGAKGDTGAEGKEGPQGPEGPKGAPGNVIDRIRVIEPTAIPAGGIGTDVPITGSTWTQGPNELEQVVIVPQAEPPECGTTGTLIIDGHAVDESGKSVIVPLIDTGSTQIHKAILRTASQCERRVFTFMAFSADVVGTS